MAAKRLVRDDIDKLMEYGLDLPARTIYFMEDVEEYSVAASLKALDVLDRTAGEITIKLSTLGGDWYAGMALYDCIAAAENHVKIVGMGNVMSMGGIILQAGDERILTEHSTLLVHYGSDWAGGHVKDLERRALENKRTGVLMENVFLKRIHEKHPEFTRDEFKQRFAFDVYLSPQEAIALGLADSILE